MVCRYCFIFDNPLFCIWFVIRILEVLVFVFLAVSFPTMINIVIRLKSLPARNRAIFPLSRSSSTVQHQGSLLHVFSNCAPTLFLVLPTVWKEPTKTSTKKYHQMSWLAGFLSCCILYIAVILFLPIQLPGSYIIYVCYCYIKLTRH